MKNLAAAFIATFVLFTACESVVDTQKESTEGEWLVPANQVVSGGVGRDGIPAIENPQFQSASTNTVIEDDDLVVGFKDGSEIRAYPHDILDRHEIVNDELEQIALSITYCPLTGSALGWDRHINGKLTTFGVSGLLYNTNLIPYDRLTESNWSQMEMQAINGELAGETPKMHFVVETSWETWTQLFPDSKVLTRNTGYANNYDIYPYRDYKTNHNWLLFAVNHTDNRVPSKERVLGVSAGGAAKAYRFNAFASSGVTVHHDNVGGESLIVAGSLPHNFIVAFSNPGGRTFTGLDDEFPAIMQDSEGNKYNIFGEVIDGAREGERLGNVSAYMSFFFAWGAFNPDTEIFTDF